MGYIAHRAVTALGCNVSVWDGAITDEDISAYVVRLASNPEWPPGNRVLADMTTMRDLAVPDDALLDVLFEGEFERSRDLRVAAVVRGAATFPGFRALVTGFGTRPVATLEDACLLLDVPLGEIEPVVAELRAALPG